MPDLIDVLCGLSLCLFLFLFFFAAETILSKITKKMYVQINVLFLLELSHLRLVEDPCHGTNCGGNSEEHNQQALISVFINQVGSHGLFSDNTNTVFTYGLHVHTLYIYPLRDSPRGPMTRSSRHTASRGPINNNTVLRFMDAYSVHNLLHA